MENKSIFKILSKFKKDEIKQFQKFINSPYFNNQKTLIRFFDEIKEFYPDFRSEKLDKKTLFGKINQSKEFDEVLYRKYVSGLTKLAEEFLIQAAYKADPYSKSLMLLEQYYRRRLNSNYEKTLKKIESTFSSQIELSDKQYLNMHMLEEIKINFELMNERVPFKQELLYNTQYYLFNYFIILSLNNLIELKNYHTLDELLESKDVVVSFIRNFDFSNFVDDIKGLPEERLLTIKLNFYNLMIVQKPSEVKYYREMKSLVHENAGRISTDSLYLYLVKLNNYCIQKVNNGDDEFVREIFTNYDFALHNDKYIEKIKLNLSYAEYRNSIHFALELGEIEWAEWFVSNFSENITADKRPNALHYANAMIDFEKGNFDGSLSHLSRVEFVLPILRFDTDVLLSKLYFKLNYFDACYSLIDSMLKRIHQNKTLTAGVRTQYLNYLKFYKLLLDIRSRTKAELKFDLLKEIENEKMLISARWLKEEAAKIMKYLM